MRQKKDGGLHSKRPEVKLSIRTKLDEQEEKTVRDSNTMALIDRYFEEVEPLADDHQRCPSHPGNELQPVIHDKQSRSLAAFRDHRGEGAYMKLCELLTKRKADCLETTDHSLERASAQWAEQTTEFMDHASRAFRDIIHVPARETKTFPLRDLIEQGILSKRLAVQLVEASENTTLDTPISFVAMEICS